MKIQISNFGPIDEFNFDLTKDIHIIYGENEIGKSYAAASIYLLLKSFLKAKSYSIIPYYHFELEKPIAEIIEKTNGNKKKRIDITNEINLILLDVHKKITVDKFKNSLLNTYFSFHKLKNQYSKENFSFKINFDDNNSLCISQKDGDELQLNEPLILKKIEIAAQDNKEKKFVLFENDEEKFTSKNKEHFVSFLKQLIFDSCIFDTYQKFNDLINNVYFLPASRSGLYQALSSFTPILAELSQKRYQLGNFKIELPSLPEPLSDYFLRLSTIEMTHSKSIYSDAINKIQKDILQGEVIFDNQNKKINFKPDDIHLNLDLSEASSMVSELSPIVLYLKYIMAEEDSSDDFDLFFTPDISIRSTKKKEKYKLLFIEEPEAHLHPKSQVKLMDVLTDLPKQKTKVVITSHSNYMFNKLNNLILEGKVDPNSVAVYHMIKEKRGSIVNPNMKTSKNGIEDFNFIETAEKLYNERISIYEDLNTEE